MIYANDVIITYATGGTAVTTADTVHGHWYEPTPETPAQREAAAALQAKLQVATQTAERLWLAHLNERQRATWTKGRYVEVTSARGRRYRIRAAAAHNVYLLNANGREIRQYCAYGKDPGGMLPMGDHLFVQLLTLQFDEHTFLAKANTWDLLRPDRPFIGQGVDADAENLAVAA